MNSNRTPLFTAYVFGLTGLIDHVGHVKKFEGDQKNGLGYTGLYLASAAGHEYTVRMLIGRRADVNLFGGRYSNPVHAACFAGHVAVVQILINPGANAQSKGVFDNALQASFLGDHEEIYMILLEKVFHISNKND